MTGPEILAACAASPDSPAWDEFCSRYHHRLAQGVTAVYRRAGYLPSDDQRAEHVQDVYVRLLENERAALTASRATTEPEIDTYLYRIAQRVTIDTLRREAALMRGGGGTRRVDLDVAASVPDAAQDPEARALYRDNLAVAARACGDALDRAVLALRLAGWRASDIARRAATTESTVYTRIHRLKDRLKEQPCSRPC